MASILITGGSGYLGKHLCQYLLDTPEYDRVAILSRDWHKQKELSAMLHESPKFRWFIGDVRDIDRLKRAFNGIDYIIHAAAMKEIRACTYNPREAYLNNVQGTQNVIDAAIDLGVKKVLFVSTDKASASENCYGQTKALAESLVIGANAYSPNATRFSSVRYGNVFGSSSSVVPIFKQQKESGVLTVNHSKMTRFWIKPEQAVFFVMTALEQMIGGEVFVPKLPASTIVALAEAIAPQAEIKITGIIPGEKIHEIMISPTESQRTDELPWAYRIKPVISFTERNYPEGKPVPWDWTYTSASTTRLTVEQLREMI